MTDLEGKVAIVTGGGGEIGGAISRMLADKGAKIVAADIDIGAADNVANAIKSSGRNVLATGTDVRDEGQVRKMVDAASRQFGRIDILVNCAGVVKTSSAVDLDEKVWNEAMNVNAKGAFLCCKHVARHMIKNNIEGRIVTIASQAGKRGEPYNCAYCASKAAAISITQTLALELAPYKITVNAVCPGVVETQMMRDVIVDRAPLYGVTPEVYRENFLKEIPLGRIEQPEDVAKAVLFLVSEYADYITGQALNVTGGMIFH